MKARQFAILFCVLALAVRADEGMWLFNQPPRQLLRERYQFDATDAWLDHLQKSSVRIGRGSGSFVSEDGLLISNLHVVDEWVKKLGSKGKDYFQDGFYARTPAGEMKCAGLEVDVLQSIEDVTARVNAAVPKDASDAVAFAARRKIIAEIEKESLDRTGLRSEVVTLWEGGAYHLYRYKRYTDVRLVFAPEQQIANYGGEDPYGVNNFPDYALDICLLRAYENGQPAKVKVFLKFSPEGAHEGDLVFVSGHPAQTFRSLTLADVELRRDSVLPSKLEANRRQQVLLAQWSMLSEESARRAKDDLLNLQNNYWHELKDDYAVLLDPELIAKKAKSETDFKTQLAGMPEFADALAAYEKIAEADKIIEAQSKSGQDAALKLSLNCDSLRIARQLLTSEHISDSSKASLERRLFSDEPIYTDYEIVKLADSLAFFVEQHGMNDPLVQKVLAGKSPRERAAELINGTKVRDVAFRKRLFEGGAGAISATDDPMIEFARMLDPEVGATVNVVIDQNSITRQAAAAITRAKIALLGTSIYPDATRTLRLSFGTVKGYAEDGQPVPAFTTFAWLYERAKEAKNRPPFDLPPVWEKRKSRLDLNTRFNSVNTCDSAGGSSGSPVVNRAGDFVGILYSGNWQGEEWDYVFNDRQGRTVAVESAAILEALDKVYGAKELERELLNGRRSK